jgi:hypothetical protein
MADDPFSIPLPPSLLTAASPNINHTNKVSTPEKTTENGQEMINFMHDEDYSDPDNDSGSSNACSDPIPSPSLLILYPLFKNDIMETKNKSRSSQKLNDSLADDNPTDQVGDTMLPIEYSNPSSHHILVASVSASLTHTHVEDYPMSASRTKIRGELTDSMLDKSASDGNNHTMLLDNYLNPLLLSPMTAICTSKNKTKDVQSSENRKRDEPKLNDFTLHNQSPTAPCAWSSNPSCDSLSADGSSNTPTNIDIYDDSFSENDMEIGQEPTMFTPNDDITDMSNKTPLLATGCT